jgi:hypothetical protein
MTLAATIHADTDGNPLFVGRWSACWPPRVAWSAPVTRGAWPCREASGT